MSEVSSHPIDDIYDGLKKELSVMYPGATVIDEYPEKEEYVVPSIVFECSEFLPAKDSGTGQLSLESMWDVTILLPAKDDKGKSLKRVARVMSSEIAQRLQNRSFSKSAYPFVFEGSVDANLDKHVSNMEVWTSTFSVVLRVGDNDWEKMGTYPENNDFQSFVADKVFKRDSDT